MTSVRKTQAHADTQGEGHMTTEADGGEMRLQATQSRGLPATAGGRETPTKVVTWSLWREHGPRDTSISDFQTADLRVDKSTLF